MNRTALRHALLPLLAVSLLTSTGILEAQILWEDGGVQVCAGTGGKTTPSVAPDDQGGAFVVWVGGDSSLHVQHLSRFGQRLWGDSGLVLRRDSVAQARPFAVSDGELGVILVWREIRQSGNVNIAQRLDRDGWQLWQQPGVTIDTGEVFSVSAVSSGSVFIFDAANGGIHVRRLDIDGHMMWARQVDASGYQLYLWPYTVTGDGHGGAYASWLWVLVEIRQRQPYYISHEAFCHLDSLGLSSPQHLLNGEEGLGSWGSCDPVINCAVDTGRGAILIWTSIQQGGPVYYSRTLDTSLVWPVRVAASCNSSVNLRLVTDNAGGAVACFRALYNCIRIQRVNATGPMWGPYGVFVDSSQTLAIAADDSSGAIVVCGFVNYGPLKAHRFRSDGSRAWQIRLCPESDSVGSYVVVNDHCGAGIAVWAAKRYDGWTVLAQRLNLGALGVLGRESPGLNAPGLTVCGSPARGRVSFSLKRHEPFDLVVYANTGRKVWSRHFDQCPSGTQSVRWNGTDDAGRRLPSGVYTCCARTRSGFAATATFVLLE